MIEHENDANESIGFPAPIEELSSLYPRRADRDWDAFIAKISAAAEPELARRRGDRGLLRSILRWSRPVTVAAAAVLLAGAIGLAATNDSEALSPRTTLAEVVDREPASALLASDRPPTAGDLARALDPDSFQQVQP
ncbi:MAG: hypothetical protein ABI884_09735 [Gemmatimonadota bacterium]